MGHPLIFPFLPSIIPLKGGYVQTVTGPPVTCTRHVVREVS